MDTHTPKASSKASRPSYSAPSTSSLITESSIDRSTPAWQVTIASRDGPSHDRRHIEEHGSRTETRGVHTTRTRYPPPPTLSVSAPVISYYDFPEELAQMLVDTVSTKGEDLREAFREASIFPPITKQSLSELDIQNIITNVRLRHDVNFDRDLSFRPNLDGERGHAKQQKMDIYWTALVAELQLYGSLFQGLPALRENEPRWRGLTNNARRRIPVMFQTIQEILKSLVPDRDHLRVEEHLDVSMLMQEIERGVCDLVRLAEWMAQLLKEHCAPMRDSWVDKMVASIRTGVADGTLEEIVRGMRQLLNILETMKLDVANHQIRNLKTLLIEDTINFEKHYHLDRLVGQRSRVNIDVAQTWYIGATRQFTAENPKRSTNNSQARLEIFVRAVIAEFLNKNEHYEFPDTFYLDQDRLRALRAEIEDLIQLEVCMDAFAAILKQFGYDGSVPSSARQQLQSSLLAIMADALGYGSQQWVVNSEALSLELLRQASHITGHTVSYSHENLTCAHDRLLHMFYNSHTTHKSRAEYTLLNRVMSSIYQNTLTTPIDLFNNLVPVGKSVSTQPTHFLHLQPNATSSSPCTLNAETARWQDIANRVTHIVLLHWRVWEQIAYVQEDEFRAISSPSAATSSATALQPLSSQTSGTAIRTFEVQESGPDAHVAHETSSQ